MEYTPEIGKEICIRIAADYTVDDICEEFHISKTTFYNWMRGIPDFSTNIAQARETQADAIAEKIRVLAKKIEEGHLLPEQGKVAANLLQWLAAKKKPKVYGDKMTLAGDADNPLFNLGKRMDALRERRQRRIEAPVIDVTPVEVVQTTHPGEQFA